MANFPIIWRVLVVDDQQADEIATEISGKEILAPDEIVVEPCPNFDEALVKLEKYRFDLIILDLKDDRFEIDDGEKSYPGEVIFESIRERRFIPVIFYSAFAGKVKHLENQFVRAITREGVRHIPPVIKDVFSTRLPQLIRHLEEEQRKYMWNTLLDNSIGINAAKYDTSEIVYLLARRLANVLESSSIKRFLRDEEATGDNNVHEVVHPIEMYAFPSPYKTLMTGDIIKDENNGYLVVLNPSCDLVQNKLDSILVARCISLQDQPEFEAIKTKTLAREVPSNSEKTAFLNLIKNTRKTGPERYHFLPETFFLSGGLIVDFKDILVIPLNENLIKNRITSLDSPFSEALSARYIRYFSRLGTPDLDNEQYLTQIIEKIAHYLNHGRRRS